MSKTPLSAPSSLHAPSTAARFASTAVPLALLLAASLLAAPLSAEEAEKMQTESKRCISTTRIDNTEILNDRSIVFHMLGKDIYLNNLPHRCPGMRRHKGIAYKTQTSQLCNVDTITILETAGGISRGPTCGLGHFTPITKEELKALKNAEKESEPESKEDSSDKAQ